MNNTTRGLFLISCLAFLCAGAAAADHDWAGMAVSLVLGWVALGYFRYRKRIESLLAAIPATLAKANVALDDRCNFIFNAHDTGPVEQCVHDRTHLHHGIPHLREDGFTYMPPELEERRG